MSNYTPGPGRIVHLYPGPKCQEGGLKFIKGQPLACIVAGFTGSYDELGRPLVAVSVLDLDAKNHAGTFPFVNDTIDYLDLDAADVLVWPKRDAVVNPEELKAGVETAAANAATPGACTGFMPAGQTPKKEGLKSMSLEKRRAVIRLTAQLNELGAERAKIGDELMTIGPEQVTDSHRDRLANCLRKESELSLKLAAVIQPASKAPDWKTLHREIDECLDRQLRERTAKGLAAAAAEIEARNKPVPKRFYKFKMADGSTQTVGCMKRGGIIPLKDAVFVLRATGGNGRILSVDGRDWVGQCEACSIPLLEGDEYSYNPEDDIRLCKKCHDEAIEHASKDADAEASLYAPNPTTLAEVEAERRKGIRKGFTAEHDDGHENGEIMAAVEGVLHMLRTSEFPESLLGSKIAPEWVTALADKCGKSAFSTSLNESEFLEVKREWLVKSMAMLLAETERIDRRREFLDECQTPSAS